MDTSWYKVSDLEDVEFHWVDADLIKKNTLRPGLDTRFFPLNFSGFEMG